MDGFRARFTSRERAVVVVLALYTTLAMVLLTPIGGALGDDRQAALPAPVAGAITDPAPERAAPAAVELDAASEQRARDIVAADRALAKALGAAPRTIVKSGPWTTSGVGGSPVRLLGAAFVVAPPKSIELRSVALPGALYDQTERNRTPYQSVVNTVSAKQVTQLMVLVDLNRGQVVNITPGPDAQDLQSVPPPGFRRTVPAPREEGR